MDKIHLNSVIYNAVSKLPLSSALVSEQGYRSLVSNSISYRSIYHFGVCTVCTTFINIVDLISGGHNGSFDTAL